MGCGIHSVLQKRINNKWETIDVDVIQLGSSYARAFNDATNSSRIDVKYEDLENEYNVQKRYAGEDHYMGEHSLGVIGLDTFCDIDVGSYTSRVSHHTDEYGTVNIEVEPQFCMDDIEGVIKTLQEAFKLMYFDLKKYRLIVGYDS